MTAAPEVLEWLERNGSRKTLDGMARYGIVARRAFGLSMAQLNKRAKQLGTDHELARDLWKSGWYEARLLAALIGDPAKVTPREMDAWVKDFENWGDCDTVCFKLWDRTPHAWARAKQWVKRHDEYVRRAGFVLMACLAGHDKTAADAKFKPLLPLIEQGAGDERNFVKKGVSWALRGIGHRSLALNGAARALAKRLAASDDATRRWVGKDVLRDITRPAVLNKLRKRSSALAL